MWSIFAFLLLFDAIIRVNAGACEKGVLPLDDKCTDTFGSNKVNTDAEALLECMERYPTNSLTAEVTSSRDDRHRPIKSGGKVDIKCTVEKHEPCKKYQLPKDKPCQLMINWKVHNEAQATATCLEYFPTTFAKGEQVGNKIRCTVQAAFQCVEKDAFLMFDKCYSFPTISTNPNVYYEGTIPEYEELKDSSKKEKGRKKCNGGKLSVFYSHTHAKFLGMKANELGIDKLWIGITKDGYSIEDPTLMVHSKLWKLVEGDYWDMENNKPTLKQYSESNDAAKYFFFRTRNDLFNSRFQGSFERATKNFKATFACEFEAKFTEHQKWYCDKMPKLSVDAVYDVPNVLNNYESRCLYISANSYSWKGDFPSMKYGIKGCQEEPSPLHSSGMDDGTATPEMYEKFQFWKGQQREGKLRIAGYFVAKVTKVDHRSNDYLQAKCTGSVTNDKHREKILAKWRYHDHHGTMKLSTASQIPWLSGYPLNECSDFPSESITLGLKKEKKIDMPPEVRAKAICSITFFQECERRRPCDTKFECKNMNEYQENDDENLRGFFKCKCPGPDHQIGEVSEPFKFDKSANTCNWQGASNECAWMHFYPGHTKFFETQSPGQKDNGGGLDLDKGKFATSGGIQYNDKLFEVVVRDGCKITVRAHEVWDKPPLPLLDEATYGTHVVPQADRGTLAGAWYGQGATSAYCTC